MVVVLALILCSCTSEPENSKLLLTEVGQVTQDVEHDYSGL